MSEVTYTTALHIRIHDWMEEYFQGRDYLIKTKVSGEERDHSGALSIDIKSTRRKRFLWMRSRKPEHFIARLWVRHHTVAPKPKNYVLLVFGLQYVEEMQEFAAGLAWKFGVKVHVRLEDKEPRDVVYDSAFD